jgi:hypothetical protein
MGARKMVRQVAGLLAALALGGCSVVGIRSVEEPAYQVTAKLGEVEIRAYGPRIAAEAIVAGDEIAARNAGFRKVAGYIFGGNVTRQKIEMTAPVAQDQAAASEKIAMTAPVAQDKAEGGQWRIRFFMPSGYTMETLPTPTDPDVTLVTVAPEKMAVLRFTGARDGEAIAEHEKVLRAALSGSAWQASGSAIAWFYDPPWTIPFLRRNEVAIPVTGR